MPLKNMIAGVALMLATGFVPAHANLLGSSVTGKVVWPDLSTEWNFNPPTVTVTSAVEFHTEYWNIDVTDSQIIWENFRAAGCCYDNTPFNGVHLTFTGVPTITNVSLNGSSTFIPKSFFFADNEVWVNVAGKSWAGADRAILDVTVAAAIPEPETYVTLLVGLGLLGFVARRRMKSLG